MFIYYTPILFRFFRFCLTGKRHTHPRGKELLIENEEKLVLYFNTEFPPLEFQSETGEFIGLGAEIVKKVEETLSISFKKIASNDWNKVLDLLRSGECAIAPTIVKTPEREEYAFFTSPYAVSPVVIIMSAQNQGRVRIEDLSGYRIGVVSGYATENYIRNLSIVLPFSLITFENVSEGIQSVAFGQVDAFVENIAVAAYYIKAQGISNLRVAGTTDYNFIWSIGVSRKYPLLYSALQKAVESISETDMSAMHDRWMSLEINLGINPETLRLIKTGITFFTILLMFLFSFYFILKHRLNKRIEQLRASEKRYRRLAENSPAMVFQFIMNNKREYSFPYISDTSLNIIGLKARHIIRNPNLVFSRIHPEDIEEFNRGVYKSAEDLSPYHSLFRIYNGKEYIWLEVYSNPDKQPNKCILWDGFAIDVTDRKKAEEALRISEEKLRAFFSAMEDIIVVLDNEGRYKEIVPTNTDLLYRPMDELIGQRMSEILPLELAESFINNIHTVLREGRRVSFDYPLLIGSDNLWFTASMAPFTADSVLGIARNITGRKKAEEALEQRLEEKEILLREIHHRVKNSLTVITSLLNLQSSSIKTPEEAIKAFEDSRDRIMSMALLYEKLYESDDCSAVDLREYILDLSNQLLLSHCPNRNIDFEIETTGIYLDVNMAIPLGLILNELIANALIHAFPVGTSGIVKISIASDNGKWFSLSVSDNGLGLPPDYNSKNTVGLTMVKLLTEQLEGIITHNVSNGTSFTIGFPKYK